MLTAIAEYRQCLQQHQLGQMEQGRLCYICKMMHRIYCNLMLVIVEGPDSHFRCVHKFHSWCHFEGIGLEIKFRPRGKQIKNEVGTVKTPTRKCKICKLL